MDLTDRPNDTTAFLTFIHCHVKLGNELLEVRVIGQYVVPRLADPVEHPVGKVKPSILQTEHQLGSGADEIEENKSRRRIMRSVQKPRLGHILMFIYRHRKWGIKWLGETGCVTCIHRGKISERFLLKVDSPPAVFA